MWFISLAHLVPAMAEFVTSPGAHWWRRTPILRQVVKLKSPV
jgi:hypothetical protein